jgi:hypothetical protein
MSARRNVDCVFEIESTLDDYDSIASLRKRGLGECKDEGAPLCRLVLGDVDIGTTGPTGIGPTNRWYCPNAKRIPRVAGQ